MSARTSTETPVANQAATEPAPVAPRADPRPVIVCFGDSITSGYGLDPSATYPVDLERQLESSGYHYRVVNLGVSGETTKDGLRRVSHVLSFKPAVVVVEFGGNDGLRGLPLGESEKNLATMVKILRNGGVRVLLVGISLPPDYGSDYVNRFNAIFPAVAKETGVPLYPFVYKGVYGVSGSIQEDGVHPTSKGAEQVARNIAGALLPLIHK